MNAVLAEFLKALFGWALGKSADHTVENGKQYVEKATPWLLNLLGVRGLRLNHKSLFDFYKQENPFSVQIGERTYFFPATRFHAPSGTGLPNDQLVEIVAQEDIFRLDPLLDSSTKWLEKKFRKSYAKNGWPYPGRPWRIARAHVDNEVLKIETQRCRYYDSLRTSFSLDVPSTNGTLREQLHGSHGRLPSFSESRLPNHIGVVLMIETSDGKIIAQQRSKKVSIRPGTLSSSASGTVEMSDFSEFHSDSSMTSLLSATTREAFEELGVIIDEMYYLGLFREYLRGGHPDFYFFARSKGSFADLKKAASLRKSSEITGIVPLDFRSLEFELGGESAKHGFETRVSKLLERNWRKANLTLVLGIAATTSELLRRFGPES